MPSSDTERRSPSPKSPAATKTSPPPVAELLGWKTAPSKDEIVVPKLGPDEETARRPSIAFLKVQDNAQPSVQTQEGKKKPPVRRLSSPPPPPVFQPRVSFDTFDTKQPVIEEHSFTLMRKHKDYEYTKRSRTFLVGLDENEYSTYALEWLIEELVDDGDEIVALRVIDTESRGRSSIANAASGNYKRSAEVLIDEVQSKNVDNKAIQLVLEFAIGKINKVIADMINLYEPAMLIVGTRGRSTLGFQGLMPGSVSKYCLQHSPVPVIVVRPNTKRAKGKRKRAQDPTRHKYQEMVKRSSVFAPVGAGGTGAGVGAVGGNAEPPEDSRRNTFTVSNRGHILDPVNRHEIMSLPAGGINRQEMEAAAVAAALGVKGGKGSKAFKDSEDSPIKSPNTVAKDRNAAMAALMGVSADEVDDDVADEIRDASPDQVILKDEDSSSSDDEPDNKTEDVDSDEEEEEAIAAKEEAIAAKEVELAKAAEEQDAAKPQEEVNGAGA